MNYIVLILPAIVKYLPPKVLLLMILIAQTVYITLDMYIIDLSTFELMKSEAETQEFEEMVRLHVEECVPK